jgi:hypothetical protein
MESPRWAEDLRRWYDNFWLAGEAAERPPRRGPADWRRPPEWLLAIAPFALVAAAVGVLLIAIATR